jgi:hypothetical protein
MGTTDSPISSGPLQQVMDTDKKELEEDPSNYPTILLSGGEIIEFGKFCHVGESGGTCMHG